MEAAVEFGFQGVHDEALAGNPALALEGCRYHLNVEMGFAALTPSAVSAMAFAIVDHFEEGW